MEVFFTLESGYLAAHSVRETIEVEYRFGLRSGTILQQWSPSVDNNAAFVPHHQKSEFLKYLQESEGEDIVMRVWQYDDTEFGTFQFVSHGVEHNVRPVLQACGY